jgi:hypothetical protein
VTIRAKHAVRQRWRGLMRYLFTVEEVIKPYRNDDGIYWFPTEAYEFTSNIKPLIDVGKRYVIVTRLRPFYPFQMGSWLFVDGQAEAGRGDEDLIRSLRSMVEENAIYGSSPLLTQMVQTPFGAQVTYGGQLLKTPGFRTGGLNSPHPDGRVDPGAYSLSREMVREAKQDDGTNLLVVRYRESRTSAAGQTERRFTVLEDLLGRGMEPGQDLWLRHLETEEQWFKRAREMALPYTLSGFEPGFVYVVLIEIERDQDGPPVLSVAVPDLREDGPTVRLIRSWVEDGHLTAGAVIGRSFPLARCVLGHLRRSARLPLPHESGRQDVATVDRARRFPEGLRPLRARARGRHLRSEPHIQARGDRQIRDDRRGGWQTVLPRRVDGDPGNASRPRWAESRTPSSGWTRPRMPASGTRRRRNETRIWRACGTIPVLRRS